MFSLPDINALNARAKSCATAFDRETKVKKSVKHGCECCGKPSTRHDKWYDIFSDDAKGVRHLCEEHAESGSGDEGYFTCECCDNLTVENYTWEYYRVEIGGLTVCLKCAAKRYFGDDDNLLDPKDVKSVILDPSTVSKRFIKDGVLNLAKAKHVLGMKQPLPEGIEFVENFEFDSYSGKAISGGNALETIKALDHKFFVVLDSAYQFACSIGIYRRK